MSSLSPSIQTVIQLFQGPLASVRFANIDATGLSHLAAEVEDVAAQVQAQEMKLTELRQTLAQRQEALLGLAQQALAYARIYAEGDDALTAELDQVSLPRVAKPKKKETVVKASSAEAAPPADGSSAAPSQVEGSAPGDADGVVVRLTEPEPEASDEAAVVATTRRTRGRAKTGTART